MKQVIPHEVWEQHSAILAKPGRGKTIAAKGGATWLLKQKLRVGVVDPTAAWWGMRLKADGITPAFPMVIFGGDHADIPITEFMGEKIGTMLGQSAFSWIIDIQPMGIEARTRFMTDFSEAIFAANRRRINLFLDECHLYMPQQKLPTRKAAHMTQATTNLVSGGRSLGFCVTMISQRSAKVHKDALTTAETMITLGMIAPQDIDAAERWVKVQGDVKAAKKLLESLPSLPVGQGWVYAPALGMMDRVKFPMIDTFDSSKAPGPDDPQRAPSELGQINIEEIRAKLAPVARKVVPAANPSPPVPAGPKAKEPAPLPPGIVQISTREIQKVVAAAAEQSAEAVRMTIPAMLDAQHAASFTAGMNGMMGLIRDRLKDIQAPETMPGRPRVAGIEKALKGVKPPPAPAQITGAAEVRVQFPPASERRHAPARATAPITGPDGAKLGKCETAILRVLAHFPAGADRRRAAMMAGYSADTGSFRNAISTLRTAGLLHAGDPLTITAAGVEAAGDVPALPTGADLLAYWQRHHAVGKAEREILGALVKALPGGLSRDEIGAITGYSPDTGSFRNALSRLRTLQLIEGKGRDDLKAAEDFA